MKRIRCILFFLLMFFTACATNQVIWYGQETDGFMYIENGLSKNHIIDQVFYKYDIFVLNLNKNFMDKPKSSGKSYYQYDVSKNQITIYVRNKNQVLYFKQNYCYENNLLVSTTKDINGWIFEVELYSENGSNMMLEEKCYKPGYVLYEHFIKNLETNEIKKIYEGDNGESSDEFNAFNMNLLEALFSEEK